MYPQVGDNIDIEWETKPEQVSDGVSECVSEGVAPVPLRAEVIAKEECSKEKHGSKFKFKLKFVSGEVRETRLMHKQFRVVSECVSEGVSEGEGGVKSKEKKDKKTKKEKKDKKDKKDKKRKVDESDGVQSEEKEKEKAGSDRDSDRGGIPVKKRKRKASTDTVTDTDTGTGAGTDTDTGSGIVSSTAVVGGARGLPVHRFILAPMVGGSELAFRLLCRRYGTELAYTPMMNSEKFAVDAEYRKQEFQTTPEDRPLVAHFSANNPQALLAAARHIEDQCDAIDLNLGCPQRIAHSGHFGSYLLGDEDRELVLDIVRTVSSGIRIPMFVKIRLLNTPEETLTLCRQLVDAGAALIAIHGRYRVNLVGRSGPGARDGAAHLDQIKDIKEEITSIPIIANGNIITGDDARENLEFTGADGVMSAEGILDNPALFLNAGKDDTEDKTVPPDGLTMGLQYLDLVDKHPVPLKSVIFHIRRICKTAFSEYQLLEDCLACTSVAEVREVVEQGVHYSTTGSFVFDPYKEKRRKEMLAAKKREEGKRKAYEQRMVRKSKREGRDINYYLNIGAKNPTQEILEQLKALKKDEAFEIWKRDHSQHCYAHHFEDGGCKRDRTCAFLHSDVTIAEAVMYG